MKASRVLRWARRRGSLSQRALAGRAGVAQSTIARIESGVSDPHASQLDRLLEACAVDLEPVPRLGIGVDPTHLRENLKLSPGERLERIATTAKSMAGWQGIARRQRVSADR